MSDLTSLIERIEAATEGSRELDVAVVYALYPNIGPYAPHCQGDEPIFYHAPYYKQECPNLSTSIDAALTLLPDNSIADVATTGVAWVDVTGDPCLHTAKCATAPLALLAAILRARQTEAWG